jgi:NAD(P)H-dependent FMN reductase
MITIISGTNRQGSNTAKVARQYKAILTKKGLDSQVVDLEQIDVVKRSKDFEILENEQLVPADKFIFVSPEYNGSIPGILKLMIDQTNYRKVWPGKKALLVGVSTGRAGNLRGMDHLASILGHLGVQVHPNHLPISQVDKLMNSTHEIQEEGTLKAINKQLDDFISF